MDSHLTVFDLLSSPIHLSPWKSSLSITPPSFSKTSERSVQMSEELHIRYDCLHPFECSINAESLACLDQTPSPTSTSPDLVFETSMTCRSHESHPSHQSPHSSVDESAPQPMDQETNHELRPDDVPCKDSLPSELSMFHLLPQFGFRQVKRVLDLQERNHIPPKECFLFGDGPFASLSMTMLEAKALKRKRSNMDLDTEPCKEVGTLKKRKRRTSASYSEKTPVQDDETAHENTMSEGAKNEDVSNLIQKEKVEEDTAGPAHPERSDFTNDSSAPSRSQTPMLTPMQTPPKSIVQTMQDCKTSLELNFQKSSRLTIEHQTGFRIRNGRLEMLSIV